MFDCIAGVGKGSLGEGCLRILPIIIPECRTVQLCEGAGGSQYTAREQSPRYGILKNRGVEQHLQPATFCIRKRIEQDRYVHFLILKKINKISD